MLKDELNQQKITHKDLADKLEMPKATLETKFIRKNPPDIDFVYKVSKVLNVSMEYLVSGENPPYKKDLLSIANTLIKLADSIKSL